jgi:hypothetical protein
MELNNFNLLLIAALVFPVVGASLILYEVSSGFATFQIFQFALTATTVVFLIVILVQRRKKITRGAVDSSSSAYVEGSERPARDGLLTETRKEGEPIWKIFVVGAFAELLAGAGVFVITEGRANNWIFLAVFVAGACMMFGTAQWIKKKQSSLYQN